MKQKRFHPAIRLFVIVLLSFCLGSIYEGASHHCRSCVSKGQDLVAPQGTPLIPVLKHFPSFTKNISSNRVRLIVKLLGLDGIIEFDEPTLQSQGVLVKPHSQGVSVDKEDVLKECEAVRIALVSEEYINQQTDHNDLESCLAVVSQPTFSTNVLFASSTRRLHQQEMTSIFEKHDLLSEMHHLLLNFPQQQETINSIARVALNNSFHKTKNIALAVVRPEEEHLLQSFLCTAEYFELDFSSLLLLCLEEACHKFVQNHDSKIRSVFVPRLISFHMRASKGFHLFALNYVAYCLLQIEYDLVLLDSIHYVPMKSNLFQDKTAKHDIVFATMNKTISTKSTLQRRTSPWIMNTGMILVRSNIRTKYLFSRVIVLMDQFLQVQSSHEYHATTLSELVWEQTSMFGLRPKILKQQSLTDSIARIKDFSDPESQGFRTVGCGKRFSDQ